ncbi:hypothetical protein [Nakamurella endophytica]|uniref:Uncharacterized protein n=1 Tax=Nakamurella endophytica TaxID=1748367 RepID=A0A917SMI4_9ACTN|nr:hypothetical protein [Nakamurella endophytica]GGL88212.1 hypothetical protein GCM10011594_04790 [Nakamurella endophytica]
MNLPPGTDRDPGVEDAGDAGASPTDPARAGAVPAGRPTVDRATLDRVFGVVLPDVTADEVPDVPARHDDDWYRENRPPHHGG